jgi:hypothetical protein
VESDIGQLCYSLLSNLVGVEKAYILLVAAGDCSLAEQQEKVIVKDTFFFHNAGPGF